MKRLRLEIEVPDFNVDDVDESALAEDDLTVFDVVIEEWMRSEVGVTMVTIPGEKCMSDDFEIQTRTCVIVSASIVGES